MLSDADQPRRSFASSSRALTRESPGERITFGHLEALDAEAAVEFARQRAPSERLAVIGISLGGAAALLAPKPFWSVPGASHVDLFHFAPDDYRRHVLPFLATHLRQPG